MKYPHLLVLSVLVIGSFLPAVSEARIGEGRETLERRLLSSGAVIYRDDAIEANRQRGMPYVSFLTLLEDSADVRIYFKTADGRRPQSAELNPQRMGAGWDLHVVYVGGKSAIEVYKRSQGISKYEMNELLARQAAGSYWKKVERGKAGKTALGYEMERADGALRARKHGGDGFLVFDTALDLKLAEMKEEDLKETAPASVEGF